jgi:hypothetical protein
MAFVHADPNTTTISPRNYVLHVITDAKHAQMGHSVLLALLEYSTHRRLDAVVSKASMIQGLRNNNV